MKRRQKTVAFFEENAEVMFYHVSHAFRLLLLLQKQKFFSFKDREREEKRDDKAESKKEKAEGKWGPNKKKSKRKANERGVREEKRECGNREEGVDLMMATVMEHLHCRDFAFFLSLLSLV